MLVSFVSQVIDHIENTFRTVIRVNRVTVTVLLRTLADGLTTTYVATVTVAGIKVFHATIDVALDTRPNAPNGYAAYYDAVACALRFATEGVRRGQISVTTPALPQTILGMRGAAAILEYALTFVSQALAAAMKPRAFQPLRTKGNFALAGFEPEIAPIEEQIVTAVQQYHAGDANKPVRTIDDTLRAAVKEHIGGPFESTRIFMLKNTVRFDEAVAI
jgi:hypothetical protein